MLSTIDQETFLRAAVDDPKLYKVCGSRPCPYVPLGQMSLVRASSAKLSGVLNAAVPVYWNIRKAP